MSQEPETISVVLGVFNKPNRNDQVYHIDKDRLKTIMDEKVGKFFGEMQYPALPSDPVAYIERVGQIDPNENSGILQSYSIVTDNSVIAKAGKVLTLYAEIQPSEKLKEWIAFGRTPYFGIRTLGVPRANFDDKDNHKHFNCSILFFDVVPEDPRRNKVSTGMLLYP